MRWTRQQSASLRQWEPKRFGISRNINNSPRPNNEGFSVPDLAFNQLRIFKWLKYQPNTVEPVLSGHPRGMVKWPLNTGWPPNTGCKKNWHRVKIKNWLLNREWPLNTVPLNTGSTVISFILKVNSTFIYWATPFLRKPLRRDLT